MMEKEKKNFTQFGYNWKLDKNRKFVIKFWWSSLKALFEWWNELDGI